VGRNGTNIKGNQNSRKENRNENQRGKIELIIIVGIEKQV
jgi:hypothetical protein